MSSDNGRFATFIDSQSADDLNELPLIHSTSYERVVEIARMDYLDPKLCPVCNEPLLYLFYGRPAFHAKCTQRSFPVCFVFKPHITWPTIACIYPFDSGAAMLGQFSPHISSTDFIHYELNPCIESAKKVIKTFFRTNEDYLAARVRHGVPRATSECEIQRYCNLIGAQDAAKDDRRSCIEVCFRERIGLKERLLTVILPTCFLQVRDIREAIYQKWKVCPMLYDTWEGTFPSAFQKTVFAKLKDYLIEGDYL